MDLQLHLHGKLSMFSLLILYKVQIKTPKFSKGEIIHNSCEIKENSLVCPKEEEK